MAQITVRPGDTLSGIALDRLGKASRWPEIWRLNRDVIEAAQKAYPAREAMMGPHWIFPGTVLTLPQPRNSK